MKKVLASLLTLGVLGALVAAPVTSLAATRDHKVEVGVRHSRARKLGMKNRRNHRRSSRGNSHKRGMWGKKR